MGCGRSPLILPITLPENAGACKLAWNDGYELHVSFPVMPAAEPPGTARATIDLGEIDLAAVTTNTGEALVVSGRGIRSLKRRQNMALGKIARKRSRCQKGSRRFRKLQRARRKVSTRIERRVRDLRQKGKHQVVEFCQQQVGTLYTCIPSPMQSRSQSGRPAG
jgi:putative transposase